MINSIHKWANLQDCVHVRYNISTVGPTTSLTDVKRRELLLQANDTCKMCETETLQLKDLS